MSLFISSINPAIEKGLRDAAYSSAFMAGTKLPEVDFTTKEGMQLLRVETYKQLEPYIVASARQIEPNVESTKHRNILNNLSANTLKFAIADKLIDCAQAGAKYLKANQNLEAQKKAQESRLSTTEIIARKGAQILSALTKRTEKLGEMRKVLTAPDFDLSKFLGAQEKEIQKDKTAGQSITQDISKKYPTLTPVQKVSFKKAMDSVASSNQITL